MLLFSIDDVKRFMGFLFKDSLFDDYEARGVILQLFTRFEINCLYDKSFEQPQHEEGGETPRYCLWKEIHPTVFSLIKGKKPPKLMKIILCIGGERALEINENASSLYITIKYENGTATILTGVSQKQFSLDKNVDNDWDEYVKRLFHENGFKITEDTGQ